MKWQRLTRSLRLQVQSVSRDLERAHAPLLERAREVDPSLIPRLALEPPAPRPSGYGVLPEIEDDSPPEPVELAEQVFSLERLTQRTTVAVGESLALAEQVESDPRAALEPRVETFERVLEEMRSIESNLAYHEYWQQAILDYPGFFDARNAVVAALRERFPAGEDGERSRSEGQPDPELRDRIARFHRTRGLVVERRADGRQVLPVTLSTDVTDEAFLAVFREAVHDIWNGSPAAQARRFAIEVRFDIVAAETLYPEGSPAPGTPIDPVQHVRRFPAGGLVLTTGGASTHAWSGRSLVLGPSPVTRHTLAHELGHLLGFDDAYVRGYDGDPSGPFGATIVEWTGLVDDLMGNPQNGEVTDTMLEKLVRTYTRQEPVQGSAGTGVAR